MDKHPSKSNPATGAKALRNKQQGAARVRILVALGVLLLVGWAVSRQGTQAKAEETGVALYHTVGSGEFIFKATEAGDVESSSNVEVACEVKSRNSAGTIILEIVPEGTWVNEGDFVCKLDDSDLQTQLLNQQIDCNASESKFIAAQAALENARLSLDEYEKGTFPQEVKQQESSLFVSRENLRRAEEFVGYSQKLASRGYISEAQLEADQFAVEKARKELEVAEAKMNVLQTLTRKKDLNDLQAKFRSAQVALDTQETIFQLAKDKLAEIRGQIKMCIVTAPASGQVVYANRETSSSKSSSGDILIEEGKPVREKQVIVRLPDPAKMQVFTKVNEARIDRIKVGQKAEIKLDAFSRMTLQGVVKEISDYPLPPKSYLFAHIKEYATIVEILDPPASLRPGMTSEVSIFADHLENAIQVPLQSVIEVKKGFYCVTGEGKEAVAKPVQLGPANEEFVVVERGLSVGEVVAMNPYEVENDLEFPPYPADFVVKKVETNAMPIPTTPVKEGKKQKEGEGNKITSLPKKPKDKKQRIQ